MNALTSLPIEVHRSAQRGELQKVVKWLNKGGAVGALCSFPSAGGRPSTTTLLQTAAANGHMAMVNELLKRGASVDLQTRLGVTPLMTAAYYPGCRGAAPGTCRGGTRGRHPSCPPGTRGRHPGCRRGTRGRDPRCRAPPTICSPTDLSVTCARWYLVPGY